MVPGGIAIRGDTTVIATADGLQITTDDGAHWTAIGDTVGPPARGPADTALPLLTNEYVAGPARPTADGWLVTHPPGQPAAAARAERLAGAAAAPRRALPPANGDR